LSRYPELVQPEPGPTSEELAHQRIIEIKVRLNDIDLAMIRGLDARDAGTATAEDNEKLVELRAEKRELREELAVLEDRG